MKRFDFAVVMMFNRIKMSNYARELPRKIQLTCNENIDLIFNFKNL